jgi:hypothetical protein
MRDLAPRLTDQKVAHAPRHVLGRAGDVDLAVREPDAAPRLGPVPDDVRHVADRDGVAGREGHALGLRGEPALQPRLLARGKGEAMLCRNARRQGHAQAFAVAAEAQDQPARLRVRAQLHRARPAGEVQGVVPENFARHGVASAGDRKARRARFGGIVGDRWRAARPRVHLVGLPGQGRGAFDPVRRAVDDGRNPRESP